MFFFNPVQFIQYNGNSQIQPQQSFNNNVNNLASLGSMKVKKPIFKPHSKFSEEDDERLRELVKQYGDNSWIQVASQMPGRNSRQCRERWLNYLSPKLNTAAWTQEEDELLLEKQKALGTSWVRISKFFEGRTDQMCKNRFFLLQRKIEKKPYKRRNVNAQSASNIIGAPFMIPRQNGMINFNMNNNLCTSASSTCSSSSVSPLESCTASPIQMEIKPINYSDKKETENKIVDAPIVSQSTDLSFIDNLYHDQFDYFDSFIDMSNNNSEYCDDFFMI